MSELQLSIWTAEPKGIVQHQIQFKGIYYTNRCIGLDSWGTLCSYFYFLELRPETVKASNPEIAICTGLGKKRLDFRPAKKIVKIAVYRFKNESIPVNLQYFIHYTCTTQHF